MLPACCCHRAIPLFITWNTVDIQSATSCFGACARHADSGTGLWLLPPSFSWALSEWSTKGDFHVAC